MRTWQSSSIPATNGSSSGPASASATSRMKASARPISAVAARKAGAGARRPSTPVDIDLVICATATPDRTFPATAVTIQNALGVTKGAAFDVQAVCSGFVYALTVADNFLKTGPIQARRRRRRGDVLAHSGLVGPLYLRAVRRRRGRGRARGAAAARHARGPRYPRNAHSLATDASRTCSTSMAARARPRPWGTSG